MASIRRLFDASLHAIAGVCSSEEAGALLPFESAVAWCIGRVPAIRVRARAPMARSDRPSGIVADLALMDAQGGVPRSWSVGQLQVRRAESVAARRVNRRACDDSRLLSARVAARRGWRVYARAVALKGRWLVVAEGGESHARRPWRTVARGARGHRASG